MELTKEQIEETIRVWQPHSKEKLTEADAVEIYNNFIPFVELILELDAKQKAKAATLPGPVAPTETQQSVT